MYSFKLVKLPTGCASCRALVNPGLAGHYYQDPMCARCFSEAAPEYAEALLSLQPKCTVSRLDARRHDRCANCGDNLVGNRFAGYHFGDALCTMCFQEYAPELAALLVLHESAIDAADGARDAPGMLNIAVTYLRILYRLDAWRAEKPPEGNPDPTSEPIRR